MVFILSHGESDNKVMAKDGPYDIYELIEKFIPNNLGILHGKPKLFFIQACRGCNYDNGQIIIPNGVNPDDSKTELGSYIHPKFADVLISFSTYYGLSSVTFHFFDKFIFLLAGHYSFSNEEGSWFIQDLCYVLEHTEESKDIYEILNETNTKVAKRKNNGNGQISGYYSTLVRKFLLTLN